MSARRQPNSIRLLTLVALLAPGLARADPCSAPLPDKIGQTFAGAVRYVGDGDSLCVGASSDPTTWIEVRLADFDAPELAAPGGAGAKIALQSVALGREAVCETRRGRNGQTGNFDRVFAVCRIDGRNIGDRLRAAGVREGGH